MLAAKASPSNQAGILVIQYKDETVDIVEGVPAFRASRLLRSVGPIGAEKKLRILDEPELRRPMVSIYVSYDGSLCASCSSPECIVMADCGGAIRVARGAVCTASWVMERCRFAVIHCGTVIERVIDPLDAVEALLALAAGAALELAQLLKDVLSNPARLWELN